MMRGGAPPVFEQIFRNARSDNIKIWWEGEPHLCSSKSSGTLGHTISEYSLLHRKNIIRIIWWGGGEPHLCSIKSSGTLGHTISEYSLLHRKNILYDKSCTKSIFEYKITLVPIVHQTQSYCQYTEIMYRQYQIKVCWQCFWVMVCWACWIVFSCIFLKVCPGWECPVWRQSGGFS